MAAAKHQGPGHRFFLLTLPIFSVYLDTEVGITNDSTVENHPEIRDEFCNMKQMENKKEQAEKIQVSTVGFDERRILQ